MKLFPFINKDSKQAKGYTLLFSVIVSVLLLSIAAFILSVSRKQFILSSASRDSIYAFYSANSGLECALENLTLLSTSTFNGFTEICGNHSFGMGGMSQAILATDGSGNGTSTFYLFTGTGKTSDLTSQSGVGSCAMVTVAQWVDSSGGIDTQVTSRGYNIGWNNGLRNCSISGPRKVERALQYTQYQ